MKHTILLIILAFAISSCKSKTPEPSKQKTVVIKKTPADLGDLYQYYHATPQTLDQKEENQIIEYLADKNLSAIRTKNGVYIHTSELGAGEQIKWGEQISVDYKGAFLDGTKFDSSYDRGEPISFKVGTMNAGWNDALPYLTKGTKATFFLPSRMGYGKKGFPGFVGPDKILVFDVDVYPEAANK